MFIVLEGIDGAGKTTVREYIAEWFRSRGKEVVVTREPGGTPQAEKLRALILSDRAPNEEPLTAKAKTLLFMAAREQHIETLIRPNVQAGKVVISDRFCDSTFAYQSYEGMDLQELIDLHEMVFNGFYPDLTIVLDGDPAVFRERMVNRAEGNYYDRMPEDFHAYTRKIYLELARVHPGSCVVIDATQDLEGVKTQIDALLNERS